MNTNCNKQIAKVQKYAKLTEFIILCISFLILGLLVKKYVPALELLPPLYFAYQVNKRFIDEKYIAKSVDYTMTALFKRLPARFKSNSSHTTTKL